MPLQHTRKNKAKEYAIKHFVRVQYHSHYIIRLVYDIAKKHSVWVCDARDIEIQSRCLCCNCISHSQPIRPHGCCITYAVSLAYLSLSIVNPKADVRKVGIRRQFISHA